MSLGGDQIAQRAVAGCLAAGLRQRRLRTDDPGTRLLNRQRIAGAIDHKQQITCFHGLVVMHLHRGDQT